MLSSSCGHLLYPRFDTCSKPRFQSSVSSCPGLANSPLRGRFGAFWVVAGRRWHPKAKATRIFVLGRPRNTCQRAHTYTRNMHPVREQIIRVQMFSHTCTLAQCWMLFPVYLLPQEREVEGRDVMVWRRCSIIRDPSFFFVLLFCSAGGLVHCMWGMGRWHAVGDLTPPQSAAEQKEILLG